MKRFDFEDEDDNEDFPNLDELTGNEYDQWVEHAEYVDLKHLSLKEYDLNQKLIYKSIKLCENSFFWKFKSAQKKLQLIREAYIELKYISELGFEKEEENEE